MYPQQQNNDILSKLLANKKLLILVIVGVVILLITVVTLLSNSGNPVPGKLAAMQTHLDELSDITSKEGKELVNGDLRDQGANVSILLAGAYQDIQVLLGEGKISQDEKAKKSNAARLVKLEASFESAKNTNTLDETYQKEVVAEVITIEKQLTSYAGQSKGKTAKTLLEVVAKIKAGREALEKVEL